MGMKTVLVAAKGEIFREGLITALKREQQLQVVSICNSGLQAIEESIKYKPDIIIVDDAITDFDFIQISKSIQKAQLNSSIIILMSGINFPSILTVLCIKCVKACIVKDIDIERLVDVIGNVSKGYLMLSAPIAQLLNTELDTFMANIKVVTQKPCLSLTKRQLEILTLISEGLTNKEIAKRLIISENTTKAHIKKLLEKLDVENRQQAVNAAIASEILPSRK